MSISTLKSEQCCGCSACEQICPQRCIEMRPDRRGFLHPHVDAKLCTECGACERICPFLHPADLKQPVQRCYAAWAKDPHTHLTSASGGAATVLARSVINDGGVVYGASFIEVKSQKSKVKSDDANIQQVAPDLALRHIRVDNLDDLPRLQGSKYVQSSTQGVFAQVRADLRQGCRVMFVGTPCQTAALKSYLRKPHDRLLLIDLVCHGIPSPKMLASHIRHLTSHLRPSTPITSIRFRSQDQQILALDAPQGPVYESKSWEDSYSSAFLSGWSFRQSCHHCPFCAEQRVGDITLGDFWGLDHSTIPDCPQQGVSLILTNNAKGQSALKDISTHITLHERPYSEALAGNPQLRFPVAASRLSSLFEHLFPTFSFDHTVFLVRATRRLVNLIKR
ncbi:MAG: Coenzyme F420 hydrogenase/dehydrogenase, beta subunit C-terminal domain [Bacteroidales bacterium]|nr:Coenzyme F420 hydrogenase/dehydrogenase, beta subunit C-terminal domain [Bacteroidales bacterium]